MEIKIKNLPDELSAEEFNALSYQEREMWLLSGDRDVKKEVWDLMDDNFRNLYIREFSNREDDLDNEVYTSIKGSKYENLYNEALMKRIEDQLRENNGPTHQLA